MATSVDATDTVFNVRCPRNVQKSFILALSAPIPARTISWVLKVNRTDSTVLLTKDNAGIGGITLNSSPQTVNGVVYPANQVATLTIAAGDFFSMVTFQEHQQLWHGWKLTGPAEEPAFGYWVIYTEP